MNSKIDALIAEFASNLRAAIAEEAASMFAQIASGDRVGNGRRAAKAPKALKAKAAPQGRVRRSAEDLEALGAKIIGYIRKNPEQRADQIAAGLGISTKDMVKPVALLLEAKSLKRAGQRRGTTYTAR